jgi:tetratricopeptide (TPR) repeat protein
MSKCFLMVVLSSVLSAQVVSPVDARIAAAQQQVKAKPQAAASYDDLAAALIRKARDYRDQTLYAKANAAVDEALKLSKNEYEAQKLRAAILLGMDQPQDALALATALHNKVPDDLVGWSLLVDANVALGNYDAAEKAAQWILDLRPGSALGFEKAAGLRELFGDVEGSVEFYDEAIRRTSQNDGDQRAWLLTQKARLLLSVGNTKAAADMLAQATRMFPDSQLALAVKAQVNTAEGNFAEAAKLCEQRYQTVPSAANLYDWAEALAKAGQTEAASVEFKKFENSKPHDAALQLISYYADRKNDPAEALALAAKRAEMRHDAATLEVYAWALYRNGKFEDAKAQMDKALAVGLRNSVYFCQAARIAASAKDAAAAERYAKEGSCPAETQVQTASGVTR